MVIVIEESKMHMKSLLSSFVVLLLILAGVSQLSSTSQALSAAAVQQGLPSLAPMLQQVTPAVVSIRTSRQLHVEDRLSFRNGLPEELQRYFHFDRTVPLPDGESSPFRRGAGSGVIVDAQRGYVVTNHHVVESAEGIEITLNDGRSYTAELVGSDRGTDIALLQIAASDLRALDFADSDSAEVGDFVVAIGNPFGLGQTVTAGIISAVGRAGLDNDKYEDFIQTDAAINMGNSGGALVDLEGRLVGINAAIISSNGGGSDGIGFAVPANMVAAVVGHLERDGEVRRGMLGVQISDNSRRLADALGLSTSDGALVARVLPGSTAEQAGLEVYDVITAIDGDPVSSGRDLRNLVALVRLGQTVELQITRGETKLSLAAVIGGRDEAVPDTGATVAIADVFAGARLASVIEGGLAAGVEVLAVDPGSQAARAGLEVGDIVIEVNRQLVRNLQEFNQQAEQEGDFLALTVLRDERPLLIMVS
jgi:serine protease DegQ